MTTDAGAAIIDGRTALGIELGSTRIKAVLIGPDHAPLAVGRHDWENQLVGGLWTGGAGETRRSGFVEGRR